MLSRFLSPSAPLRVALLLVWLAPLAWVALGAFQTTSSFTGATAFRWTLENFSTAYSLKNWVSAWTSSAVTATATTIVVMLMAIPCAYAIARWPSRSNVLLGLLIGTRILPPATTVVAYLILGATLGLLDSWAVLVVAGLILQLGWIAAVLAISLSPYSPSLEEWMICSGSGPVRAAVAFVLNRARPQLLALTVVCWLFEWGEFFYATTMTAGGKSQTVTVLVAGFSTGQDIQWGPMFAACLLAGGPAIIALVAASTLFTRVLKRIDKTSHQMARGGHHAGD